MTKASKEALKYVSWIYYPLHLQKNLSEIKALIDFNSEVNTISLNYAKNWVSRCEKPMLALKKSTDLD